MSDPYKSPDAAVDLLQAAGDFRQMQRLNTVLVFVLSVGTFGLYMPYWAITRTNRFNTIYPAGQISLTFTYAICAVYISSYVFDLFEITGLSGNLDADMISIYASVYLSLYWTGTIGFTIWVFYFRYKFRVYLERVINNPFNSPNIVLTFFFGIIYLNFKINQTVDDLNLAEQ